MGTHTPHAVAPAHPSEPSETYSVYHAYDPWAMVAPHADHWLVDTDHNYRLVAG